MKKDNRVINGFSLLIISFVLILSSLFIYLEKIDSNISNYNSYQHNIERIAILDQKIENFFLQNYRYIDYDKINIITKEFDSIMEFFKKSSIEYEFGDDIYQTILNIDNLYRDKYNLIENFKTINSRLTSSIHYLYDLHRTIMQKESSIEGKELSNKILFQIGQLSMNIEIDRDLILANLEEFKKISQGRYSKYFYKQSVRFIKDSIYIKKKINSSSRDLIIDTILEVDKRLLKRYNDNLLKEKLITFIFFILAFIILLLLTISYKKILKNTKELLAFRYAVENSDNIVLITDVERKIEYVNDIFEKVTGYKRDEVLGKDPNILKSNLMSSEFYKNMNEILDSGKKWQGELINRKKDGSLLYEQASIVPLILHNKTVGFLAIKLDISEYIEQQNRLKRSSIVFENTKDGIIILDRDKNIININSALSNMSGYSKSDLIGKLINILNPSLDCEFNLDKLWTGKILLEKKDKTTLPVWLNITDVYDDNDKLINFIAIYTDLSEIIRTQERADFLKYHDSLTLLPNRSNFERELFNIFKENKNNIYIMLFGIDRFKLINDSLGHSVGDKLLINLSKIIQDILPKDTLFARWDNDRFILLLNMDRDSSTILAKDILKITNQPIVVGNHRLSITLSIGISNSSNDVEDSNTLIKNADIAMYSAKDRGRNRFEYYEKEIYLNIQSRLNIEQELENALERDEFVLNYQPQYDIKSKKIIAVETLIRWHSKKLGLISPVDFIYILEENGLIVDIGYWIFREACSAFMRWQKMGIKLDMIAINVSSIQFRERDFLERIIEIIEDVGISPKYIEIELTESYILDYSTSNLTILNSLRELGCSISIDDFGTGYSSMSYLKKLPIDTVKIDQSFISDLSTNRYDKTVSKAIIALAHSLDYRVVAEGIETIEQDKLLEEYNCDIGQGYLVSKPLEEDKLIEFILSHNSKKV